MGPGEIEELDGPPKQAGMFLGLASNYKNHCHYSVIKLTKTGSRGDRQRPWKVEEGHFWKVKGSEGSSFGEISHLNNFREMTWTAVPFRYVSESG